MNFVIVFICGLIAAEENIAGEGVASQTDNYFKDGRGRADLAIDGNTNGMFDDGSVSHTGSTGRNAVWTLDFSKSYFVTKINIWNRQGTYQDLLFFTKHFANRLNGAILRLDGGVKNKIVTLYTSMGNPAVITVNDEVTRVSIYGANGQYLHLAEVEVFGYEQDVLPSFENVAGSGRASQVDNYNKGYLAENAIDGNIVQTSSSTHTESQGKDAWWRLDFDDSKYVSKIRVWNRYDNHHRLNGVTVRINDQSDIVATLFTNGRATANEIKVEGYVESIMINGGDSYLSLAEVEVFARDSLENVAGEGKATQSNNKKKNKFLASEAIDRDLRKRSMARTKKKGLDASWRLDFSKTYYVSTIKIHSSKKSAKSLNGASLRLDGGEKNILVTLDTTKVNPILINVDDGVNRITITAGDKKKLEIVEVEVFGYPYADYTNFKNVAAEGEASQSTDISRKKGGARLAIDGNTDPRYKKGSATHTSKKGRDPYWRLDFSETYYVSQIRIWDSDRSTLNGASLQTEGGRRKNLLTTLDTEEGNPIVINVDDSLNRVTIAGVRRILSLAEVEVFGHLQVNFTNVNIAMEGVASQSDDYFKDKGFAMAAIDGDTDGRMDSGSVTHTKSEGLNAFWKLDFSKTYFVSKIQIWNRVGKPERLNGVSMRLEGGEKNLVALLNTKQGNPIVINVEDGVNRITMIGGNGHLSLAEVEVFGYADPDFPSINNIAGLGIASQTDNYFDKKGHADVAIDGNTDGRLNSGSVTHTSSTGKAAVWTLNLKKSYYVTKIQIWNRIDKQFTIFGILTADYAQRLNGVILRLDGGQKNILVTLNTNMGNPAVIDVNDEVEYVTLIGANGKPLSLAEVEVFGYAQDDLPNFENVAATGIASSFDSYNSKMVAGKAIDGNTDGSDKANSFYHSKSKGKAAWWRLEFDESYNVSKIRVWNRYHHDGRLNGATVRINDQDNAFATLASNGASNPVEIRVDGDVKSIMINGGDGPLQIAEVEVFAVARN